MDKKEPSLWEEIQEYKNLKQKKMLQAPKETGGKYTKLQQGDNRLRIVSDVMSGWECWVDSNGSRKPIRQEEQWKANELVNLGVEDKKQKQFYMAIVWNYQTESFECMLQTQKAILNGVYYSIKDPDWGDITKYDINIKKDGQGIETSYNFSCKPHKEFMELIPPYNLKAMFEGGDPFEATEENPF